MPLVMDAYIGQTRSCTNSPLGFTDADQRMVSISPGYDAGTAVESWSNL
jgi:hypothetical protein